MAFTTSKVRLWDRTTSTNNTSNSAAYGADALLLHPETEFSVVSIVPQGGLVSSGNSLIFSASSAWDSGLSGIVNSYYVPQSKTVNNKIQYADMYTSGGSATVTEITESTGYGTLLNTIQTRTDVRGIDSATNTYVPTERAVAMALAQKQQVISGGTFITVSAGNAYTAVDVNAQVDMLPSLADATNEKLPTEYVVRYAINEGDAATSNYASGLVSALHETINNSGFANSTWVLNNFWQKGEDPGSGGGGGGDWSYATTASAGVVMPIANGGLTVGANGSLTLAPASTTQLGGVSVPTSGGLAITAAGVLTVSSAAYVTTSSGSQSGTTYIPLGGVRVWTSGGIDVTNGVIRLKAAQEVAGSNGTNVPLGGVRLWSSGGIQQTSGTLRLATAGVVDSSGGQSSGTTYMPLGGIRIWKSGGLSITNGTLYVSEAPIVGTYESGYTKATNKNFGGVTCVRNITSGSASWHAWAVVPTVQAVYDYVAANGGGYNGPFTVSLTTTANTVDVVSGGYVKWLDGQLYQDSASNITLADGDTLYLMGSSGLDAGNAITATTYTLTAGGKTYTRQYETATTSGITYSKWVESNGRIKWLVANTQSSGWTADLVPTTGTVLYTSSAGNTSKGKATSVGYVIQDNTMITTVVAGATVYSATTSSAAGRQKYVSGTVSCWIEDESPVAQTVLYTTSDGTTSVGGVTAIANSITVTSDGTNKVYSRTTYRPINDVYAWSSGTAVMYTADAYPINGDTTAPGKHQTMAYTTTQPSLPPAGAFYTMLAKNEGGVIKQQQYGTIWHEHWGDDYKGQFAISRIRILDGNNHTVGTYPYKYVVANGGLVYGGIDFRKGGFGLYFDKDWNLQLVPGNLEYPIIKDPNDQTKLVADALYPPYGAIQDVWLTIIPPDTVGPVGFAGAGVASPLWRFLVNSECMESYIQNAYSIYLGWLTVNGAPQQEHKGAIAIRGRWA